MEFLLEEVRKQLPILYSQENEKDPLVQVKFFYLVERDLYFTPMPLSEVKKLRNKE